MESSEPEWLTRYVVLYESPPEARARAPEFFAAHSAYADEFRERYPGPDDRAFCRSRGRPTRRYVDLHLA